MTDQQFEAWLATTGPAYRCVLVEAVAQISGVESTLRMSTTGYTDNALAVRYPALLSGKIEFTERLSLEGSPSASQGDIRIINVNGERDHWLGYVWSNRPVRVYIGDSRWARAGFRLFLDGVADDLTASDDNYLSIKLRNKLQRLNAPVTEDKVGGTGPNADALAPVMLGECFNASPVLTDPAAHEYQFGRAGCERMIEARDTGVPITVTADLAAGKFSHTQAPTTNGLITCSAQGERPGGVYINTIAPIVRHLATAYGAASLRLSVTDIDDANFADFDVAHPQPVGVYLRERANVNTSCQDLAASVGAQVVMSRLGKLQLVKVDLPAPGLPVAIRQADIVADSFALESRPAVLAAVRLGYCRNWSVQAGLQSGIPSEHKVLYADEWRTVTVRDSGVAAQYQIYEEPAQANTNLLREADAQAEAERRLDLRRVPRTVYKFTGLTALFGLTLGRRVTLKHQRYGLQSGVDGIVMALRFNLQDWTVQVEALT